MCGKAVPFRALNFPSSRLRLGDMTGGAQVNFKLSGKAQPFRTSGGEATSVGPSRETT